MTPPSTIAEEQGIDGGCHVIGAHVRIEVRTTPEHESAVAPLDRLRNQGVES